ncbi:MAG TPA: glycosyl transferase family protein [Stellaceae bacterium]|nr:glycosyl transferase family protein [Stellaceae bacterium]
MAPDTSFPTQDPNTYAGLAPSAAQQRLAGYVAALGRGPGKSRALSREEARDALGLVLNGLGDPHQVGALLMLLRFRGEEPEEIAGLVEAARGHAGAAPTAAVALDWPSYGAGRTRGCPWFLLAAMTLGAAGMPVLMHGSNEFSSGMPVADGLAALGLSPARARNEAADQIAVRGFAYLPLVALSPELDRLLSLRHLLGLRSPVNTVARLLNPFDAPAGIDGVFHPPYIHLHLGVAEAMGYRRLTVVKGAGGEAERNPLKRLEAQIWQAGNGRSPAEFEAIAENGQPDMPVDAAGFRAVWRGEDDNARALATILGTVALGLLATGKAKEPGEADVLARELWRARHG